MKVVEAANAVEAVEVPDADADFWSDAPQRAPLVSTQRQQPFNQMCGCDQRVPGSPHPEQGFGWVFFGIASWSPLHRIIDIVTDHNQTRELGSGNG